MAADGRASLARRHSGVKAGRSVWYGSGSYGEVNVIGEAFRKAYAARQQYLLSKQTAEVIKSAEEACQQEQGIITDETIQGRQ